MKFNPFSFCPYGNTNANAPMHWKPGKNLVCESVLLCVSMVLTSSGRGHQIPLECTTTAVWWPCVCGPEGARTGGTGGGGVRHHAGSFVDYAGLYVFRVNVLLVLH